MARRTLRVEEALADRIASERETRGWSREDLARRMADAGCPIHPQAIYKIETPLVGDRVARDGEVGRRRRITVEELWALSQVFEIPVEDLVVAPEDADRARLAHLLSVGPEALAARELSRNRYEGRVADLVAMCTEGPRAETNRDVVEKLYRAERDRGFQDRNHMLVHYLGEVVGEIKEHH